MSTTLTQRPPVAPLSNADALDCLVAAVNLAGMKILPFFHPGAKTSAAIHWKAGGSPVTDADLLADRLLHQHLTAAFPKAGWLSEESADDPARLDCTDVLVVDPIDGTRGFVNGDSRWTICIALVRNGRPVAGVVHAPALGETYVAAAGAGAFCNGKALQAARTPVLAGARAGGPPGLLETIIRRGSAIVPAPKIPSLAYRMVQVACGTLDVGLASNNAQDWDIAAADLIVREAGGCFVTLDHAVPVYNKASTVHPVLVAAAPLLSDAAVEAVRQALAAAGRQ